MRNILMTTMFFFLGAAIVANAAESLAGSIKTVQGICSVRRGTETIAATAGLHLLEADVLTTGSDGRVGVIMHDGTRLSLGPNTELSIDKFVYNPSEGKFALLLKLGRGMLAYASGKIASFSPEAAKVQTPVGLIGLRGTKFVVGLNLPGGSL